MLMKSTTRTWSRRLLVTLIALLGAYLLTGFLLIPAVATYMGPRLAKDYLKGEIRHGWIWLNPLTFQVSVGQFNWTGPGGARLAGFKQLRLNADPVASLLQGEWRMAGVTLIDGFLDVTINADGSLNLQEALEQREDAAAEVATKQALPSAWLGLLDVSGLTIELRDLSRSRPFEKILSPINLRLSDLRTQPGRDNAYSFNALTHAGEELQLDGQFQIDPLQISGTLSGRHILLSDYVLFATESEDIRIQSGRANFELAFSAQLGAGRAAAELANARIELKDLSALVEGNFAATASLSELLLEDIAVQVELDPENGLSGSTRTGILWLSGFKMSLVDGNRPLATFESLAVDSAEAELSPLSVRTSLISWTRPEFDIERDASGELVLLRLLGAATGEQMESAGTGPAQSPVPTASPIDIQIDGFRIEKGRVGFTDASVSPLAAYTLDPVDLLIEPLSLDPASVSEATLKAIFQDAASIELTGSIHPASPFLDTNAVLSIKEMPLDGYSPYSSRFIGRPVTAGTFAGDFTYTVTNSTLEADNKLVVDSIGFGSQVPGYTGKTYPIDLAVALLQNPQNQIAIDIPVRGDLTDPTFHPFGMIPRVLANLLLKAMTSPFNLVAGMTGSIISGVTAAQEDGPETDFSKLPFQPGSADLADSAEAVIKVVADMLDSRPMILLGIQGSVDPQLDMEALRTQRFDERLASVEGADRASKLRMAYLSEVLGIDSSTTESADSGVAATAGSAVRNPPAARPAAPVPAAGTTAEVAEPAHSWEPVTITRRRGPHLLPQEMVSFEKSFNKDPVPPPPPAAPKSKAQPAAPNRDAPPAAREPAPLPELPGLAQMEAALEEHWFDTDPDLAALARQRAAATRTRFVTDYGIAEERVQLTDPTLEAGARVEFTLKVD